MPSFAIISRKNQSGFFFNQYQIERGRPNEQQQLLESNIELEDVAQADCLWMRANPERVNTRQLKRMLKQQQASSAKVIFNSMTHFDLVADKLLTYQTWQYAGLACPEFLSLPLFRYSPTCMQQLESLSEQGVYLRTRNEDSGKGLEFVETYQNDAVKKLLRSLSWRALFNKVKTKSLMAVKPVDNRIDGLGYVYRLHVVGEQIIGGYALCSAERIIHVRDLNAANQQAFIAANEQLLTWLEQAEFCQKIVKALQLLGMQIGAVEFFMVNNEPIFLEVNPLWGGKHKFGSDEYDQQLRTLDLPKNLTLWQDSARFYQGFWQAVQRLIENPEVGVDRAKSLI